MEVQVLSYSNPTNTCGGSGCQCNRTLLHDRGCRCCDVAGGTSSNCDEDINSCDNIFTYCLRRTLLSLSNCDGSERMTTRTNWNGAPLNFKNETVLGLPNPFILEGLDSQWMVINDACDCIVANVIIIIRASGDIYPACMHKLDDHCTSKTLRSYTAVEPPSKGHFGISYFERLSFSWQLKYTNAMGKGPKRMSFVVLFLKKDPLSEV